ncbi:unnamed protein product [Ectocarpus sp. 8 AP-2014]
MCGARVLSGVFHRWAARRAAGAFWRLRTTSTTGNIPPLLGASCHPAVAVEQLAPAATAVLMATTGQHRPRSRSRPRIQAVEAEAVAVAAAAGCPRLAVTTKAEKGGEEGPDQLEATRAVRKRRLRPLDTDRTAIVAAPVPATASSGFGRQPMRRSHLRTKTASVFSTSEAGTEEREDISTATEAVGNASGRFSPPPPSPASSRARSMTSPPGGSFSIAWSNGGTDTVTPANSTQVGVAGGSGLIGPGVVGVGRGDTERSFFSTASSEPRYHCLRSGLSSPAWSNAGSWTGSADGVMPVDMSDALPSSSGEEKEEDEEEEGAATAVPAIQPVSSDGGGGGSGGQDGSEDGGRGGGEVHGDGSEEVGFEFGLEVSVGGGDSWWALSDEEAEV